MAYHEETTRTNLMTLRQNISLLVVKILNNDVSGCKTLSAAMLTALTTVDTHIQACSNTDELP